MLAAAELAFGPYRLDSRGRSPFRDDEPVGLSPYEFEMLHLFVRRPQVVLSRPALIRAGWNDTAVESHNAAPDLELLLAPHRAWTEGRVALESPQATRIASARTTFQQLLQRHPADAGCHIGLANACAMQFEATRTDPAPDADALHLAEHHARQACRLNNRAGRVTLGLVQIQALPGSGPAIASCAQPRP